MGHERLGGVEVESNVEMVALDGRYVDGGCTRGNRGDELRLGWRKRQLQPTPRGKSPLDR